MTLNSSDPSLSPRAQALYQRFLLALGDQTRASLSLSLPEMRTLLQCETVHPQVFNLNSHVVYPALKQIREKTDLLLNCEYHSASESLDGTPSYSFLLELREKPSMAVEPIPESKDSDSSPQVLTHQDGRYVQTSPVIKKLVLSLPPNGLALYSRLRTQIHSIASTLGIGIEEELTVRSSTAWEEYILHGQRPTEPEPPKPRRSLLSRLLLPWRH